MLRPAFAPLLLVALLCIACSRQESTASTATAALPERPVVFQAFGDSATIKAYRELISAFETAYPGRKVTFNPVSGSSENSARLKAALTGGSLPDVFVLNYAALGRFAGTLEAVGPALGQHGDFDPQRYYSQTVDAFKHRGQLFCAPQNANSLIVYYNRALFQRFNVPLPTPTWTLHNLVQAATKLTQDLDNNGTPDIYGLGIESSLLAMAPFIWGMNGELVNDPDQPSILTFDRAAALEAMNLVHKLNEPFHVIPPESAQESEDDLSRFERGKLAMLYVSRPLTNTLSAVSGLDWDVAAFPRIRRPIGALNADGYCLSGSSKARDAALEFIAFAAGPVGQTIMARDARMVPALDTAETRAAFVDPARAPQSAQLMLDAIPTLRRTPNVAVWDSIQPRANAILEEWLYEVPTDAKAFNEEEEEASGGEAMELAIELRNALQPTLLKALRANSQDSMK